MPSLSEKQERFTVWMQKKWMLIQQAFGKKRHAQRTYRMGEIYYADLGTNVGGEIDKRRPVLVFQGTHQFTRSFDSVFVLPITTNRKKRSYKVLLNPENVDGSIQPSAVVINQGRTISKHRCMNYLGTVHDETLHEIMDQFLFFLQKNTPLQAVPAEECAVVQEDRDSGSIIASSIKHRNLETLRMHITECDQKLLEVLQQRFEYCLQVKAFKETIEDTSREDELREIWLENARDLGLSESFTLDLLDSILSESKSLQHTSS